MSERKFGWFGAFCLGLLTVAAGAAGAGYYLLNRIDIRAEIGRLVERTTGRELVVAGDVGVEFWPVLGFEAADISLANVEGGRAPALLTADRIHIGVELAPLLRREVVVQSLVFDRPRLSLEVDAEGAPNWLLTLPQAGSEQAFTLKDARFNDGELSYIDAVHETSWVTTGVNLRTALSSLDQPMRVTGVATFNDRPLEIAIEVGSPRALAEAQPFNVRGEVRGDLFTANFDGEALAAAGKFDGELAANGASLRRAAAWLGLPLEGSGGFETFDVRGRIEIDGPHYSFNNATFTIDRVAGHGYISLTTRNTKPFLSSRVTVGELDLNPYLFDAGANTDPGRALDVREGADVQPIDFSGLAALNGEFQITAGPLIVQHVRAEHVVMSAQLRDSVLGVTLQQMDLYGGRARGRLDVDATRPATRMSQQLTIENVDVQRLLSDAVNLTSIEGRGNLSLQVAGQGATPRDLVSTSDGSIRIEANAGALRGVDLGGVSRTISNALRGELVAPAARTQFNALSGTFTVADGVLAADDISFTTPELSIPAVAVIDINTRRLTARLSPRPPRGGIAVPFTAEGPFNALQYNSDLRGLRRAEIQAMADAVQGEASGAAAAQ